MAGVCCNQMQRCATLFELVCRHEPQTSCGRSARPELSGSGSHPCRQASCFDTALGHLCWFGSRERTDWNPLDLEKWLRHMSQSVNMETGALALPKRKKKS